MSPEPSRPADGQSMHEVINRLEGAGLIKRNAHPNHGRKLPASLTPKGRRVLALMRRAAAACAAPPEEGTPGGSSRHSRPVSRYAGFARPF